MNEFEKQLRSQPMRKIPAAWREEILAAAAEVEVGVTVAHEHHYVTWGSALNARLTAFFWPNPKAWGALAAAWALVFALNVASQDEASTDFARSSAPTPEIRMALREQKVLLAELVEPRETPVADRPKSKPQPRSERRIEQILA